METTRLEDEGEKPYAAWRIYAEMGPQRSQEKVAAKLDKNRALIGRWSKRYKWKKRLVTWDHEQAERTSNAEGAVALELARERAGRKEEVQNAAWEMFKRLREKAEEMLTFPVGRRTVTEKHANGAEKTTVVEPARWRFSDVAKLIELADALGRLANGMSSKVTGLTDGEGRPFILPTATAPTTVIVNVKRDKESDAAVELFGERPARR